MLFLTKIQPLDMSLLYALEHLKSWTKLSIGLYFMPAAAELSFERVCHVCVSVHMHVTSSRDFVLALDDAMQLGAGMKLDSL
jgi:alkylhydroperoxidase family enzyme